MAGDWIKMRPALLTSPKVNGIARALEENRETTRALSTGFNGALREIVTRSVMRHVTVSALLIIWGAANEHTEDGTFRNADLSDIDDMAGIPGFGAAMELVGWAVVDAENFAVTLPNFNEYNTVGKERSASAKTPAQRQKEYRERKKLQNSDVTEHNESDVTSNHREEKRREEKKEVTPPEKTITFSVFLERCQADGVAPIPEDDPVFAYADKAGLQADWVALAWQVFKGKYAPPNRKRYTDWRAVFRNAVSDNWYGLWAVNGTGEVFLTSKGKLAQRTNEVPA